MNWLLAKKMIARMNESTNKVIKKLDSLFVFSKKIIATPLIRLHVSDSSKLPVYAQNAPAQDSSYLRLGRLSSEHLP
ncbi:hypothetical protein D3C76_1067240 [compost metagenome]